MCTIAIGLSTHFHILYTCHRSLTKKKSGIAAWKFRKLSSHATYHGAIDTKGAESKLKKQDSNCFLTRYSESRDQYTLSVRRRREGDWIFRDFDIIITKEKSRTVYEISGTEEKFDDITELLNFYQDKALDNHIDGIGAEVRDPNRALTSPQTDSPVQLDDPQSECIYTM